jgi:phosphoribosylanthranilate isomerase
VRALIPGGLDFVLAGGLGPETVADAVVAFRPDVVDVSSGVELEMGVKDHALVEAFVRAARTAAERGAADTHSAAGGAA